MNRRVTFHSLSKWIPIGRVKIRKKLGLLKGPRHAQQAAALASAESLGFGLGTFACRSPLLPSPARIERFFNHEFQVLGTDWGKLPGFGPKTNPKLGSGYRPIDWKSGFGKRAGEDIKLPWELSRFHGFAEMACLAHEQDAAWVHRLGQEVLNQLQDFSAANPVGTGAHWGCAMDVSLRALNVTVACDLLLAAGWAWKKEDAEFLAAFVAEHGRFVFANLEWYRVGRGNHYLADLLGLLVASLWLPKSRETSAWFRFAAGEIFPEAERQFLADGSNFEGSVFYHRLSLELLALAYAFLQGPARRKGLWSGDLSPLASKIERGLEFLGNLTDCRGHGVQFGDHDSGRALKLHVSEIEIDGRILEDSLDTRDTLSLRILFEGSDASGHLGELALSIAGKKAPSSQRPKRVASHGSIAVPSRALKTEIPVPLSGSAGMEFGFYEEFGVYFWKQKETELWLRCGKPSQDGHGGHAHFDQLHLEVRVAGVPITFDPGSFAYTGDPALRNFFRGPRAHFIPRLPERESLANQAVDAFRYPGLPSGECLTASELGFCGRYRLGDQVAYRKLEIAEGKLLVWDWAEGGALISALPSLEFVSWGYGERVRWPLAIPPRSGP